MGGASLLASCPSILRLGLYLVSKYLVLFIGESLFTLFASLAYAYHCLMTLIK